MIIGVILTIVPIKPLEATTKMMLVLSKYAYRRMYVKSSSSKII